MIKGKMIYIPAILLDEILDLMREEDIESRAEACLKLTKYARVGREINRIRRLDWSKKKQPDETLSFESNLVPCKKTKVQGCLT